MEHVSGILFLLYGNMVHETVSGGRCANPAEAKTSPPKGYRLSNPALHITARLGGSVFQKPDARKNEPETLDVNSAMLLAVAELLRNETVVGILHSINVSENPKHDNVPPGRDGKCITMPYSLMCSYYLLRRLKARNRVKLTDH